MEYLGTILFIGMFSLMIYMAVRFNLSQSKLANPRAKNDIVALWNQVSAKVRDISSIDQQILDHALCVQAIDFAIEQAETPAQQKILQAQYQYECRKLVLSLLPEAPKLPQAAEKNDKVINFADFILDKQD